MMLEPSTKTHFALSLLGFHEIDAMTVWFGKNTDWTRRFVVYGYSSILALLRTDPKDYGKLMEEPCEAISVEPATISAEKDLESLLDLFFKRRFGFAYVEKTSAGELGGFANLRDLMVLYKKSIFKTDLLVGDVASYPVVSMPADSSVRSALDKMVRNNFRRVLVTDTSDVISDREIISYISSIYRLGEISRNPSALLDANLKDLKSARPRKVDVHLRVDEAAGMIYENGGSLLCGEGIVTPWDLVIKPWSQKKLIING